MPGDIIALSTDSFIDHINKKLKTKYLHPDCTYLAIVSDYQDSETPYLRKLIEKSKELKVLFKSQKAVNRTSDHGEEPRNTLYIFEISDDFKPKLVKLHEEYDKRRNIALIRFRELAAIREKDTWSKFVTTSEQRSEFNNLITEYNFSLKYDYKNVK